MLPTQIGDVTDTDSVSGEGCQTTTATMLEQLTYVSYWLQGVVSWMF